MPLDVNELRGFYASPLGDVARRLIGRVLRVRWDNCVGLSLMGLGFGAPYLDRFRDEAMRSLAFMPAEQGVVNWPPSGRSSSALVETIMLPLPDASIDRILVVHALETAEHPNALLEEVWRVLTPGGRALFVVPSRRGVWARVDGTLMQVPVTEGQLVKKGALLAVIDPRPYQAALDQALAKKAADEAQLGNQKLDLQRYSSLAQQSFASRQQVDTQQMQVAWLLGLLVSPSVTGLVASSSAPSSAANEPATMRRSMNVPSTAAVMASGLIQ